MLNSTLLDLIKAKMSAISATVDTDAVKTLVMARRACVESNDSELISAFTEYVRNNKTEYACGSGLVYLSDSTGDDSYKDAAVDTYNRLLEAISGIDTTVPENTLAILPFYIQAETYLGKKEHYQDVTVRFNEAVAKFEANVNANDAVTLMLALTAAYELMSEQLFEHYMAVAQNFKKVYKLSWELIANADADTKAMAAYTIFRATDMKILLAEKYDTFAKSLLV